MADVGIGVATRLAGTIIGIVIKKMKGIIEIKEIFLDLLIPGFTPMEVVLRHIENTFQEQQKTLPKPLQNCLESMHQALREADDLIVLAKPRARCLGCCSLRNPKLSTQIRDWKTGFDRFFEELKRAFSISANIQLIVSNAVPQAKVLLQPIPDSGFVGSTIESTQMQLQTWLSEAHPRARMSGVYGMGGVGKRSLLNLVYNNFKEVRGIFDVVIWLRVSQQYQIEKLQASIAETLKLDGSPEHNKRKMELLEALEKKTFVKILDDLGHPIDLINEVGVKFGDHNFSKVLISSRSKDVIGTMVASDNYSLRIQPLPTEEGWILLKREAFTNGAVPMESIEYFAIKIAFECPGLPTALDVVAAAMRLKKTEDDWKRALNLMRNVDPSFRTRHSAIDSDLYQRLRWRYNDLAVLT